MAVDPHDGPPVPPTLFHICRRQDWQEAADSGRYGGTAVDRRDGFIHFSTAAQLPGTAARHFAGMDGLIVLEVRSAALAPALKWEPAPDGTLFPHHYGAVAASWVVAVHRLECGADGAHRCEFLVPESAWDRAE